MLNHIPVPLYEQVCLYSTLIMHYFLEHKSREVHEDVGCVNWNDFHKVLN
jgi:hypothetical protein